MSEKKKKIIISTCLILVLILAIVGISYAAFQFVGQGQQVNQITTGTIQMNYEEGTNVIRLTNALPTTDATGKKRLVEGEYFDFSVTTNITGDALINWEIAAEDFDDNTFDGSNVKFYLTKIVDGNEVEVSSSLPAVYNENTAENKKTGRPANMMSLLTGSTSTQGEETVNYRLRLYVDENYNPQGDGGGLIFKTRINVYGKVATSGDSIMKNTGSSQYLAGEDVYYNDFDDYGGYNLDGSITSIIIKNNMLVPKTALTSWDLSESGDKSVIAYLEYDEGNDENITNYKLSIGGKGGVIAPTDSSALFASGSQFFDLKSIDLHFLDTSNVTNMSYMFWGLSVPSLDLSTFDTSNVIDMSYMFQYCSTSLDLSFFNTAKVTNMLGMFSNCSSLTSLDLSSFDTSSVTNMQDMFAMCSNLTSLDLSSFDTSNVTRMQWMFRFCGNLTNITVSNLWTTENVILYPAGMFDYCGTDHVTVV